MSTSHHSSAAIFAILAASVLSSIGWVLEGEAIARIAPLQVATISVLLGGAILSWAGTKADPRPIREALKAISIGFILFSVFRNGICTFVFATCLTLTSSSKAMFLTKIEPYIVLLIQIVAYGHRTTGAHLALLGVHIAGAILLSTGGALSMSSDVAGDLLMLAAIASNALLYAPSQRYSRQFGALYTSGLSQLIGGLTLLPFMLLFSQDLLDFSPERRIGWYYIFATVLVFYVFSTALWFFSLKEVPAWLASALRCVGPVIAAPFAWIIFDARLSRIQIAGALLVVGTSAWMVVLERRPSAGAVTRNHA